MSKYSIKDKLEIIESTLSIIVSIIAIYGTLISVRSGFWHKIINWLEKEL